MKKMEEMNVLDDFLFQELINYGEIGEDFCRILISTILNRPIGQVRVQAQRVLTAGDSKKHAIRLDVLIEEAETQVANAT